MSANGGGAEGFFSGLTLLFSSAPTVFHNSLTTRRFRALSQNCRGVTLQFPFWELFAGHNAERSLSSSSPFNNLHTLPRSVSRKSFACHSYENCRVYTNNSHSGKRVGAPAVVVATYCFESVPDSSGGNKLPDDQAQTEKLRLVDQAMVDGVQGEFEAVGDAELVEDIVEMVLDGLLGDEKFFPDFLVAESLRDELHDFFFAVAEQRLFAARPGFRGLRKRFHDFGGHAIVEPDFSGVHAMNTLHQQIGRGLLQHHAARPEPHRTDHVAIVFRSGQNHDARRQRIKIDFLEHREPIFIRHAQIEQQNIGLELREHLDALRPILRFADDGDVFVGIKKFPKAIAKDRVVIG